MISVVGIRTLVHADDICSHGGFGRQASQLAPPSTSVLGAMWEAAAVVIEFANEDRLHGKIARRPDTSALMPTLTPLDRCPNAAARGARQSDEIFHIDIVIFHIDTAIFHIDTVILRSASMSILSSCHLVDMMTKSYLVTLAPAHSSLWQSQEVPPQSLCSSTHLNISRCRRAAARTNASLHGQSCSLAHVSASRCPPRAAVFTSQLVPMAAVNII